MAHMRPPASANSLRIQIAASSPSDFMELDQVKLRLPGKPSSAKKQAAITQSSPEFVENDWLLYPKVAQY